MKSSLNGPEESVWTTLSIVFVKAVIYQLRPNVYEEASPPLISESFKSIVLALRATSQAPKPPSVIDNFGFNLQNWAK